MRLSFFAFQSKLTKTAITLVFVGGFELFMLTFHLSFDITVISSMKLEALRWRKN